MTEQQECKVGEGRVLVSGQWVDKAHSSRSNPAECDFIDDPRFIFELALGEIIEPEDDLSRAISDEERLDAIEKYSTARATMALIRGERDVVERLWGKPVIIRNHVDRIHNF